MEKAKEVERLADAEQELPLVQQAGDDHLTRLDCVQSHHTSHHDNQGNSNNAFKALQESTLRPSSS
jgi:hypothetical protein